MKVGDFIKVKRPISSSLSDQRMNSIGKITEFDKNNKKVFFYQVFMSPPELPGGQQPHHSMRELIKSDQIEKEFVSNIVCRVLVISDASGGLDTWIELIRQQSTKKAEDRLEVFFVRQKLQRNHGELNLSPGSRAMG